MWSRKGEQGSTSVHSCRASPTAKVDEVGLLSYISFGWVFEYLWNAYKGKVEESEDAFPCSIFDSANVNCKRWAF